MTHYFIGELLVDKIGDGKLENAESFRKRAGGAPANVAVASSRLGVETEIIATVGRDSFGDFLEERLEEEGVGLKNLGRSDRKTTLAFVGLDDEGKPEFSFYRGADLDITEEQLDISPDPDDVVHVGSLPFTNPELGENIIELLKKTDATVSFDPNLRKELTSEGYLDRIREVVEHTDLLFAADEEVEQLGGYEKLSEDVEEIICTKGEEGAEIIHQDGRFFRRPRDVDVVDTTGAGDALTGAYLAFRDEGREKALEKAVDAAAESIKSKGAMSSLPGKTDLT